MSRISPYRSIAVTAGLAILFAVVYCNLVERYAPSEPVEKLPAGTPVASLSEVEGLLAGCERDLGNADAESFARLREALRARPGGEAIALVQKYLNSGRDAKTGLGFVIGPDQSLKEWPSLRVFLLDVLLELDPVVAAAAGRAILACPTTADEWALAMRNVARGSDVPQDLELLKAKCTELLRNAEWRENPSAGYLEAFDVIVFTRHTALTPELLSFTEDQNRRAVRHASFLTLDRLVQAEPQTMLGMLAVKGPETQTGRMISNLMARADIRDAEQRRHVESWLRDEQRTGAELEGFSGTFPNANQMVSNNLLTVMPLPDAAVRAAQDRASLAVVDEWLADPVLARARELLWGTRRRLGYFVSAQAGQNALEE